MSGVLVYDEEVQKLGDAGSNDRRPRGQVSPSEVGHVRGDLPGGAKDTLGLKKGRLHGWQGELGGIKLRDPVVPSQKVIGDPVM